MSRDFRELLEAGAGTGSKMKRDFNRILIGILDSIDKGEEEEKKEGEKEEDRLAEEWR